MKTVEVRGTVIGEGRPKILASLVGTTLEDTLAQAADAKAAGVEIAEWRIDWFDDVFDRAKLLEAATALRQAWEGPLLVTFRTANEGGEKAVEAAEYVDINVALIESGAVDLVDVEFFTGVAEVQAIVSAAHQAGVVVIASNHDFEKTPEKAEIVRRLRAMQDAGVDIAKIALMPQCRADVIALMDATREMYEEYANIPLITMSMSGMGTVSRLVGEAFGSAGTFGAVSQASAPGQVSVASLAQVLDTVHSSL